MKVLLISSCGGHWVQMCRLLPAFENCEVVFASTDPDYSQSVSGYQFYAIPDASMWSKLRLVWQALSVLWLLIRVRPNVVLSTGASSGFFALLFAKKMGMKTIWVDSIANCDELSLSGKKIRPHADLFLTQWEHLAGGETGAKYAGAVV
jgi:UDP-N-acetylglucosamine:LPS N-acetylglucosamine transferase